MKVLFLATPNFAIKFLESLTQTFSVPLIVTRPDKPSGRGQKLNPTPVKQYCLDNNLQVLTPHNPDEIITNIKQINPDIVVTVAYGAVLSKEFFSIPKYGTLNVHFSLLPKYRGAAPIQWSLINGETVTGVTVFEIDQELDTGKIYKQVQVPISPDDNASTLCEKLANAGIDILKETLCDIEKGIAKKTPQNSETSYARTLTKKDALLDFNQTAVQIHNKIRGLSLGPTPFVISQLGGKQMRVQILESSLCDNCNEKNFAPATIVSIARNLGFLVQCREGFLLIKKVRPEGKKAVLACDFASRFNLKIGDCFCS
jgi:methionyl-tRNA formyltransferase